ncbi:flagellar biosynthesis anti-sigma factor FlgM [Rahnella variigena]|jgi:negative regulator of flagellin synthesis FlgM|uniref:flagellar biosynthesis anti-sigma factor FlgM n=1 Tax=Rahnella TaxID=34037 RepID=UPI000DD4E381|nr:MULTISPECIES: flagellar biosynthesis anti-sigma factor FlgM [Rahnella]MDH2897461.1 flagellar biosynthesis anti-sigma factor FlgM [Rahnella variigena]
MSIDRAIQPLSVPAVNVQQQDLKMRPKAADISAAPVAASETSGTQIKLSKVTQAIQTDSSQDVDYDRLAKIRAAMDAGELQLDTDQIANALVEDIFQLS